jgi:uncharacterized membrane protein (DUF106 family)
MIVSQGNDPLLQRLLQLVEEREHNGGTGELTELEKIQAEMLQDQLALTENQFALTEKTVASAFAWRRVAYTLAAVVVVLSCIIAQLLIGGRL